MSKELHAVIRLDLEQKTEEDGSFSVPIAYVEIPSYVTKWDRSKDKTYSKLRFLMKAAKAPRTGYPKFGVVSASPENVKDWIAKGSPVSVSTVPITPSDPPEMQPGEHSEEVPGDSQPAGFAPPVFDPEGNWPEDFSDENGNYSCKCCHCGKYFQGHKRRVVCKVCAMAAREAAKPSAEFLERWKKLKTPANSPELFPAGTRIVGDFGRGVVCDLPCGYGEIKVKFDKLPETQWWVRGVLQVYLESEYDAWPEWQERAEVSHGV